MELVPRPFFFPGKAEEGWEAEGAGTEHEAHQGLSLFGILFTGRKVPGRGGSQKPRVPSQSWRFSFFCLIFLSGISPICTRQAIYH